MIRVIAIVLGAGIVVGLSLGPRSNGPRRDAAFARRLALRSLIVRGTSAHRIHLGSMASSRWRSTRTRLAAPEGDSVLVLGPTRSGKTSSLIIPALLSWEGPVLAASVKTDLFETTAAWRRRHGPVSMLDPSAPLTELSATFDPVALIDTWSDARRLGMDLASASSLGGIDAVSSAESMFWTRLAARLLASLLYAAHRVGGTVELVGHWVDRREVDAVTLILESAPELSSGDAWASSLARDERQLSSVYATAEAILDPLLTSNGGAKPIDPARLLGSSGTLYLCAPAHDQQRHRPLFTVTTSEVISCAFDLARRQGGRLNDPLLIVLDEAAAIAPLAELDVLAATCSSHGITLVTCFQDLAQIQARWATRSTTVVNNHRTRIVLSGLADSGAADLFGTLAGSAVDRGTLRQRSASPVTTSRRSLLEPHEIRGLPHHRGIMVSGRLPATRLALDPWWKIPGLRTRGSRTSATTTTAVPGVHGSHDR